VCHACPLGKFKKAQDTGQCQLCPPGSMAPTNGTIACERCPAGKFSRIMGSSRCASCAPGSYQTEPGATHCSVCGPGKYVTSEKPSESRDICQNCPGGKFSNGTFPDSIFENSGGALGNSPATWQTMLYPRANSCSRPQLTVQPQALSPLPPRGVKWPWL
jgi:hypothetical protein